MKEELAQGLSPEIQSALQPLLDEVESLSDRIRENHERVQQIAQESYPRPWCRDGTDIGDSPG